MMELTAKEVAFIEALKDPEKCTEIISVLHSYGLLPSPKRELHDKHE